MKWPIYIITIIVAFCIGFGTGSYNKEKTGRDTIFSTQRIVDIRHDTLLSINPLPILAYFDSKDTLHLQDTVVPREYKVYNDSNFYVVVSGAKPQLDSIKVFPETVVIHDEKIQTITNTVKQRKWNLGLHCGYGVTKSGLSPYVGVGISYQLK